MPSAVGFANPKAVIVSPSPIGECKEALICPCSLPSSLFWELSKVIPPDTNL